MTSHIDHYAHVINCNHIHFTALSAIGIHGGEDVFVLIVLLYSI